MRVKQQEHFHPLIVKFWALEECRKELVECSNFVNLYSKTRGSNRFPALLRVFELLAQHPGVCQKKSKLPETTALRNYVHSGVTLGNPSLQKAVANSSDPELERVLQWSMAINQDIAEKMRPVPPFPGARLALEMMQPYCKVVVISQTPQAALQNEWKLHGIRHYVKDIAGQEVGSKTMQIQSAMNNQYTAANCIMIGDAIGDLTAAEETNIHFFPIIPDQEQNSWKLFCEQAFTRFISGNYAGEYANTLKKAFINSLADNPPWL